MRFFRRSGRVATLALVAILTACASGADVSYVSDWDTRLQRNGFSLLPPAGKGWMTAPTGPYAAAWGKMLSDSQGNRSTITVTVLTVRFKEQGLDLTTPAGLRDAMVHQVTASARYPVRQVSYSEVYRKWGTDCIDADWIAEERGNAMSWNAGVVLLYDAHFMLCRHPSHPEWAVNAGLADRHPAESLSLMDELVRQEAKRCLESIQLTPPS
jgi:hypothetical protein